MKKAAKKTPAKKVALKQQGLDVVLKENRDVLSSILKENPNATLVDLTRKFPGIKSHLTGNTRLSKLKLLLSQIAKVAKKKKSKKTK